MNIRQTLPYYNTIRSYNIKYIFALSAIACLTVVSHILIQTYLSNQVHDSHLINFAARLRTNSQSFVKYALLIEKSEDKRYYAGDFETTYLQWKRTHESLLKGNDFLNLPENKNEAIHELFDIIQQPYNDIVTAGGKMVQMVSEKGLYNQLEFDTQLNIVLKNEQAYLLGMEMIVFDYDRNLRTNVVRLKKIKITILWITLFILLIEAVFVFRPLARKIRLSFTEIMTAEKTAKELAKELTQTNHILENSHRELREVNFALDKASYLVKTDHKGHIIYVNDKYCHVTKYKMNNLINKPLFYNNFGDNKSPIYEHINTPGRCNEVWQDEVFDHASDGTSFWLDVTLMPIFDRKQNLKQYLMVGFDITKRKKTERKLHLMMEDQMKRQKQEQKIRSQAIISGQEKERKRVAAEIHDGIGQMLTSLRMQIELLGEEQTENGTKHNQINDLIRDIVQETRRICSELLPNVLQDFGIKAAIKELSKLVDKTHGIDIGYIENFELEQIDQTVEIAIYRIAQEAVNNMIKHAKATSCSLSFESDAEYITLELSDNGLGFDKDNYNPGLNNSHGLSNMKERAKLIGAKLDIQSSPGEGTTVKLEVPI